MVPSTWFEIDEYESKNNELEEEIDKLNKDLRQASMEQTAVNKINQDVLEKNIELEQNLNSVQNEIEQMSQELSNQIMKRMKVEDNYTDVTQHLSRIESDKQLIEENKNQLAAAFEGLNGKLEFLADESGKLRKQLNLRDEKISELGSIIDEKQRMMKSTAINIEAKIFGLKKKNNLLIFIFCTIALLIGVVVGYILKS